MAPSGFCELRDARARPPPPPTEPGRNPEATTVAPGVLSPTRDSAAAAPGPPHPPHRRPTTGAPPGVGTTAGAQRLRRTGLSQAGDLQGGTSGEQGWVRRGAGGKPEKSPAPAPAAASAVPGQRSPSRPSYAGRLRQEKQEPEPSSWSQPGQLPGPGRRTVRGTGREADRGVAAGGPLSGKGRRACR